jgi:hypothetical protein
LVLEKGKEVEEIVRRMLLVLTVALSMVALMVVAVPAFAAPSGPAPGGCKTFGEAVAGSGRDGEFRQNAPIFAPHSGLGGIIKDNQAFFCE